MNISALLPSITQRGQSLLGEVASIAGVTVPVIRDVAATWALSYVEGFSPAARRVRLSYAKSNPQTGQAYPLPAPATAVTFQMIPYRVESVEDLPQLWTIDCVQANA